MSEAEGDKQWKAAQKLTSPSLLSFRMKSDWELAGPLYEKAANNFRQAKAWDKAREAFEMAAKCSQRQDSPWYAARHLERAAEAAKETQDYTLTIDYLKQASLAYREAGRPQSASEALAKGAKILEEKDPQAACDLLAEAVEELESDGKLATSGEIFRQAIGLYIRAEKYADAVSMLLRFAAACDASGARVSLSKAYLGAVVVWLYAGNGGEAWAVYQDALEVDAFSSSFSRSEEAQAAEDLFDAYRSGSDSDVKRCIAKRSVFLDLDNQVARLAKKLPHGDVQAVTGALAGSLGPPMPLHERTSGQHEAEEEEEDFT